MKGLACTIDLTASLTLGNMIHYVRLDANNVKYILEFLERQTVIKLDEQLLHIFYLLIMVLGHKQKYLKQKYKLLECGV